MFLCAAALLVSQPAWSLCSATPQAALASYGQKPTVQKTELAAGEGFRVWRTMKDPALGRRWFWIQACGAPVHPAQLLWAPLSAEEEAPVGGASEVPEEEPLVHRGDAVVVSRVSDTFSMRLAGRALEPGEMGKTIRVEIDALHRATILVGTISGKGEVRVGD